ncbi:MAG: hypothetical protein IT531_23965 [Burkholderiales bacterium]|nr:hypothetical protein [Burkholderiales bacterium]
MAALAPTRSAAAADDDLGDWLNRLPGDASAALGALREKAHALASEPIGAAQRFESLEHVRARALALLPQQRQCYLGQSLPFTAAQRQAWEHTIALWQAFYFGYALCTDVRGDAALSARVWQRALDSLGRAIREHGYAYRAVPASLWKELNNCYRSAQDCELDAVPVASGDHAPSQTCRDVFLVTVLHDAANVYALATAQVQALERWLPDWVGLADLLASAPSDAARSPLAIDLAGQAGARIIRELAPSATLRYLDTSALGAKLRDLAGCLRGGARAGELESAGDLPQAALERLLTHLYVQWCSSGSGRIDERRERASRAQAALNIHAIHFQISGRAFRQPGLRYTREEEHDLATFGHITERTEQRLLTGRSAALEPWEIVNQSRSGLLGMCRKPDLQSSIAHGQLIAIRQSSAADPALAAVQRLRLEADGSLAIGLRVIRGETRGVAVRADSSQKYERALAVAADAQLKLPPSLIVARERFATGAIIELHANRGESVRLGNLIERGFDFDRIAYAPV